MAIDPWVEVVRTKGPQHQELRRLPWQEGLCAAAALNQLGWPVSEAMGVWSQPCTPERLLKPGDRLELYRPLVQDPKAARRARATPRRR